MYKNNFVKLAVSALFLIIAACGNNAEQGKIKVCNDTACADNKPGPNVQGDFKIDVAPHFLPSQLKTGNWIQWKKSNGTKARCTRLIISANSPATGVTLEVFRSLTCKDADWDFTDTNNVQRILFDPSDGSVISDRFFVNGGIHDTYKPMSTIYNHLYGSDKKVSYALKDYKREAATIKAFLLKTEDTRFFYNDPGSDFHGFALHWVEKDKDGTWSMDFMDSSPAITISQ